MQFPNDVQVMPEDEEEQAALAAQWQEKRAMVEGIGGRVEVKHADAPTAPPPDPEPSVSGTSLRARLFGGGRAA